MSQASHERNFRQVMIGDLEFGNLPPMTDDNTLTQPNPEKITWSKKNRVVQHEIPGFPDRTTRTSLTTLWQCQMSIVVVTEDNNNTLVSMASDPGPYQVITGLGIPSMKMYIIDASASQEAAEDDQIWHWEITLLEERD